MARIIVFEFDDWRTSGRIGATLRDHGFRLEVRRPDRDGADAVPVDLDNVGGVVVMGGAQNLDENHPWITPLSEFVRAAHERTLPVLGVCLGAQVVGQALGGRVARAETPEAGFEPVTLTVPGQTDTLLAGTPWTVRRLCIHAYEVADLPPGATLLASSAACKNHIFRMGLRTLAMQSHPEVVRDALPKWAEASKDLLARVGRTPEDLLHQAEDAYEMFARANDRLCVNLATFAFPFDRLLAV